MTDICDRGGKWHWACPGNDAGRQRVRSWSCACTQGSSVDIPSAFRLKVVIADYNLEGAQAAAEELNKTRKVAWAVHVDVADWESQLRGFEEAVQLLGRIDYIFAVAGIFERPWLSNRPKQPGFGKPDLAPLDVNGTGALYTTCLAIQQFHRQSLNQHGFRGKSMNKLCSDIP